MKRTVKPALIKDHLNNKSTRLHPNSASTINFDLHKGNGFGPRGSHNTYTQVSLYNQIATIHIIQLRKQYRIITIGLTMHYCSVVENIQLCELSGILFKLEVILSVTFHFGHVVSIPTYYICNTCMKNTIAGQVL